MSRGQNTIKRSEVSTTPILLKYSASYDSSSFTANGITVNRGINSSYNTNGIQFLNYALVKQLYYQEYITGSALFSASYWNPSNQSTAASGTFDNDYRYFPTGSQDEITVLAMPRTVFGEQVARQSLVITGSSYRLIDDGNGNVLDSKNNNTHVGNILYSQGVIVISNLEYANAMIPIPGTTTTTTSTTSTTTTAVPTTTTTTTTTSTTTIAPITTTSTTTSTTTIAPTTTTSTTTSTTTEVPTTTSTTTTTTTSACTSYTVSDVANGSSSTFTYQDCSTLETVSVTISDGGDEVTFCAITGTINIVSGNVTIVDNGPCISTTTTSTTTTTTTFICYDWTITNNSGTQVGANWVDCCSGNAASELIDNGNAISVCSRTEPTSGGGTITGGTSQCQSGCL